MLAKYPRRCLVSKLSNLFSLVRLSRGRKCQQSQCQDLGNGNPHQRGARVWDSGQVTVWCTISVNQIVGSYYFDTPKEQAKLITSYWSIVSFRYYPVHPQTQSYINTVHQQIKVWKCESFSMLIYRICVLKDGVLPIGQLFHKVWLLLLFYVHM